MARMTAQCVIILLACLVCGTYAHSPEPPEEQESPDTFESDMKLTTEQRTEIEADIAAQASGQGARKAHSDLSKRWEGAIVPFEITSTSANDAAVIQQAIAYWESNSCIRFPPYDSAIHNSRISFKKEDGCWSWVGRTGDAQQWISIGSGCAYRGTIAHEIGHAIGFWHEQSRTNRDNYVTIHWENIQSGKEHNFNKYGSETLNSYNVPYDVGSLMHYGEWYFSSNGLDTITANDPADQDRMGERDNFSPVDVILANIIYNCPAGALPSTETVLPAKTQCVSPYKVNNQASLDHANAALAANGDTSNYWVDGSISGSTITFSDGTTMAVDSTLFHDNEPNGSGSCLHLWNWGGWKLDDTTCDYNQKYLCSAMPVVSGDATLPTSTQCASGALFQVSDQATLDRANVAIRTNGENINVWVDGRISGNTITFTGGSTMTVNAALFQPNEPNGSGACLHLWYYNNEWKLDDTTCDYAQKYLCVG